MIWTDRPVGIANKARHSSARDDKAQEKCPKVTALRPTVLPPSR